MIMLHHLLLSIRSPSAIHPLINTLFDRRILQALGTARVQWLKRLRMALSLNNYQIIWRIADKESIQILLKDIISPGIKGRRELEAITSLVQTLRASVREAAWNAVRVAYREESEVWLLRTLSLSPESGSWLLEKSKAQQALKVPGHDNRWKVFKTKA
jgi:hypothetical protein